MPADRTITPEQAQACNRRSAAETVIARSRRVRETAEFLRNDESRSCTAQAHHAERWATVAISPPDGVDADSALRNADIALRVAERKAGEACARELGVPREDRCLRLRDEFTVRAERELGAAAGGGGAA